MSSADAPVVLVVEDEPKLAALLADYLRHAGCQPITVGDGLAVLPAVRQHAPAVLLLDLMLPGRDGLDICRELRSFSAVPVIMLTARVEEVDRILGLEVGADDYLCKPYSPREVVARVQAQLRRARWAQATDDAPEPARETGPWRVDAEALRLSHAGQVLDLTPAEFRLVATLAGQPGRVFSRDQLLDQVHHDGRDVTDRAIDSHVRNLRRKLVAASGGDDPIRSVYGVGYAWEPVSGS